MTAIINGIIIHNKELLYGYSILFDERIISISKKYDLIDAEGSIISPFVKTRKITFLIPPLYATISNKLIS